MLQTDRRNDPYPLTWEVPVGVVTSGMVIAAFGIHLGRGIANLLAGSGWTWPSGRSLLRSLAAVLAGDSSAGLTTPPATPASAGAVTGWIIATEILLLAAAGIAALLALRRWGPGRMRGMATPAQAEATLGKSRLHRIQGIIRPDLYPPSRDRRHR